MDKSNRELESMVASQQKQLSRYETRLKDVVAAYKGLLKEKEALEASVSAMTAPVDPSDKTTHNLDTNIEATSSTTGPTNADNELKIQIATVMNSLATLSAEKSRMEASFQADKKQMRQDNQTKDKLIKELQEKVRAAGVQNGLDIEKAKSRLIVERHEREKEINDHMMMVRELQKLLSDERHLKDHLEMQLNDLKAQFSQLDNSQHSNAPRIKELTQELEQTKKTLRELKATTKSHSDTADNAGLMRQLQNELTALKQQHAVALKAEQKRTAQAEERCKKLATVHEDRVSSLESRLSELSSTVGSYDRLRQQDQDNILKLKDKLAEREVDSTIKSTNTSEFGGGDYQRKHWDVTVLIDEISQLKKILLIENAKLATPQDLSKIFSNGNDHSDCIEEYDKLRIDFRSCEQERDSTAQQIENQRSHIKTLQDKVQVLNRNIDEQEEELKNKSTEHAAEIRLERKKWKEIISSTEMDFRGKLAELEQQLQKQRERSLTLLEDKENEIKTLKTSFEIFLPTANSSHHHHHHHNSELSSDKSDDEKTKTNKKLTSILSGGSAGAGSSANNNNQQSEYHMLHYVHELSRKEVEITSLRKAKHVAESSLRQALQDKVSSQEVLHDRIIALEENVDRLERCKSREGANLEYLKNVIFSFLQSSDPESRRHMINAIGAVLKFSPSEAETIQHLFFVNKKEIKK